MYNSLVMAGPVLSIDLDLPTPVYRQIADGLRIDEPIIEHLAALDRLV